MEILRVATSSNPKSVAGAVIAILEQTGSLALLSVGAGAVNQSVKAIAIARSYMKSRSIDLLSKIDFEHTMIDGVKKTAIMFTIIPTRLDEIEEEEN